MDNILKVINLVEARLVQNNDFVFRSIKKDQDQTKENSNSNNNENDRDSSKSRDGKVNMRITTEDDPEASAITSAGGSAFDVSQRLIYLQFQGDNYSKLYHANKHALHLREEFAKRSLAAYEAAVDLASASLDATNPLRLLIVCSFCHAIETLPNVSKSVRWGLHKAYRLATRTFKAASSSAVALNSEAVYLLQTMRDKWMTNNVIKHSDEAESDEEAEKMEDEVGAGEESEDEAERLAREAMQDEEGHNKLAAILAKKKRLQLEAKKRLINATKIANDTGKKAQQLVKHNNSANIDSMGVFLAVEDEPEDRNLPLRTRTATQLVRQLRALVCPPVPHGETSPTIILEKDIAHGNQMRLVLRRIFNVYVQGSALVGLQGPRGNVELDDGQTLSIGKFLLQGPFIGFRGFVGILRDFGICKMPLNKFQLQGMKAGHKKGKNYGDGCFPTIFDAMDSLHLFHNGTPPLSIKEATMLFIECSRSSRPALTIAKYLSHYEAISKEMEAFEDSFAGALEWAALPIDTWAQVTCGLTYMQFLDFIGKAAIVAYSSEQFDSVLTTNTEKIEHFLHAQMGLLDERRWLPKVEGRLHSLKVQIESIQEQNRLMENKMTKDEYPDRQSSRGDASKEETKRTPFTTPRVPSKHPNKQK